MKITKLLSILACAALTHAAFADEEQGVGKNWIFVPTLADGASITTSTVGIISNDVWTLNAYVRNNGGRLELGVGVVGNQVGNAFTGRGSGPLDLSGEVVSLNEDGSTQSWNISGFAQYAFSSSADKPQVITEFVFPTTTVGVPSYLFRAAVVSTVLKRVTLESESCTWMGEYAFKQNSGLVYLALKTPAMTQIQKESLNCGGAGGGSTGDAGGMRETRYDDWDLSAVSSIGGAALGWSRAAGTLSLPSLTNIVVNALCKAGRLERLELGTGYEQADQKTMSITDNSFEQCTNLESIVFGPYAAITMKNNTAKTMAFSGLDSLTNIVFTGDVPTDITTALDAILVSKQAITSVAADKQVVIQASRRHGWGAIATTYTTEELALRPAWITDDICLGVYRTAGGVSKAWVVNRYAADEFASLEVGLVDDRFGDTVQFVSDREPVDGRYVKGSRITAQATCSDETTFRGWEDLPADAVVDGTSVTFTIPDDASNLTVRAWTAPKWTYLPDEGILSNRVWKINVGVVDAETRRLRVGKKAGEQNTWRSAYVPGFGSGVLDLSGEIATTDGIPWTITALGPDACRFNESNHADHPVTRFVFPLTTTEIGTYFMAYFGSSMPPKSGIFGDLEVEVIMDVPNFKGTIPASLFQGMRCIGRLVVKAPQATVIAAQAINYGSDHAGRTDLSEWDLTRVETLSDYSIGWLTSTRAKGSLKLSSVRSVGQYAMSSNGSRELDLGSLITPKESATLELSATAFQACEAATNLLIGAYASVSGASSSTLQFAALKDVRFLGAMPENGQTFVDALLSARGVPSDATKYAVIRASANLGWTAWAQAIDTSDTVEVEAAAALSATLAPRERLLGVYQSSDGKRRAWLVHKASPYDPKSFFLIVR